MTKENADRPSHSISPEARQTLQQIIKEWRDRIDLEAWFAADELADPEARRRHHIAELLFKECADRVESWLTPLPPAPPKSDCKPDGHVWSNPFGDDWTPEDGTLCDCRAVSWGKFRARGAIVLRVNEARVLAPLPPAPQETCDVCRRQSHAKWHQVARGDVNPVALISWIEALPRSEAIQAIIGYIVAITGIDYKAMRSLLASEASAPLPPAAPPEPTAEEQSWADLRADGGLPEAPREASALFVPLNAEYFEAFANGSKRDELRRYGPRWNEQTCAVGRRVVLSKGYGKAHRLTGRVASFKKQHGATFGSTYKASIERIFGTLDLYIACIGIELSAPPAAGLPPPRPAGSVE